MSKTKRTSGRGRKQKNSVGLLIGLVAGACVAAVLLGAVLASVFADPKPASPEETTPLISETVSTEPASSETPQESGAPTDSAETPTDSAAEPSDTGADSQETEDPLLLLVNRWNKLPEGLEVETTTLSNGKEVGTVMYPDLQDMFDHMRDQGVYPVVASGYRDNDYQNRLMVEKIQGYINEGMTEDDAVTEALKWVAVPGTSEHQTGLAVDINADGVNSTGQEVYQWLAEHAWEYGFILRYPEGKEQYTATDYEPWHYRYVGRENAKLIHESGLCLEEYLGNTDQSNPATYTYNG